MAEIDPHNLQYGAGASLFGMDAVPYASTGAGGSPGDTAAQTGGPVIGSPVVSAPYGSSQLPANMPRLDVTAGDTSGMSSDQAVGDNFAELSGADRGAMSSTGAGAGSVSSPHHPNAGR
jgi:hypothetical protein